LSTGDGRKRTTRRGGQREALQGAGVEPGARGLVAQLEGAEARDAHALAFGEAALEQRKHGVDELVGLPPGEAADAAVHPFDDVCLGHE
jgi:hypothetical protein